MSQIIEKYDCIVVGAGHAGCEACLAAARLGLKTIVFTVAVDNIAQMPCNPNIGGSSKGHIVREIDALGGEMGKNIDKTYIQSKMLNRSKGPAVHSLRAQADKQDYTREMRKVLENTENLTVRQAEVAEIIVENLEKGGKVDGDYICHKKINGVKTISGATYLAPLVILATGVYLNARCIYGDVSEYTGPNGLKAATHLTKSLIDNGIEVFRFKTGTPARVDKRSLDFSKMQEQKGDEEITPFSFSNTAEKIKKDQVSCYLTYTNEITHNIIRRNIDRSPLFNGNIHGTGPRYCPSIEDKVMKFPDKERHQIFVEPEGLYTNEMYLSGMSSSLPEDVQYEMYRTMPGFENVKIVRNAYAIEYDLINSLQLRPSLEFKEIEGLFGAGQINGSSGYEEAACQGLMAGINAAMKFKGKEAIVLKRSDGYIGVLIDDLVTKLNVEPYRMMTSRAEYRLLLRQDNADLRLREIGYKIGLVSEEDYKKVLEKKSLIDEEIERLKNTYVGANAETADFMKKYGSTELISGVSLYDLAKRPELSYIIIEEIDKNRPLFGKARDNISKERLDFEKEVVEQINIEVKYAGYIAREQKQVEAFKKMESKKIPLDIDYASFTNLRLEARQKLAKIRPENLGQASRISGVSPSDIAVLMVYLKN